MTPMFFVMAIMGCGDDGAGCTAARVEPMHYATMSACRAELPAALARARDLDFPNIAADCRSVGTRVATVRKAVRQG